MPQALFFWVEMAIHDLTSPVAASNQLAAGAFFFGENGDPGIRQALLLLTSLPQALFHQKLRDLTGPVLLCTLAAAAFSG